MSDKNNLSIVEVVVSKLKPALYNPRKWSSESERQLSESISRFGMVDPIIVNGAKDRKNIVIGGHFRLHVAKKLGYMTVPAVYVDIPDVEREKELNLRLNRNTGEWDLDLLKEFDTSFLMEIGFDDTDLSTIWDDALATDDDRFDVDKAVDEIIEPVAQIGDVYQMGDHRLICGDSTDSKTIDTLMNGKKANIIYTDPKYNINLDYSKGVSTSGKYGGTTNDSLTDAEYEDFLKTTLSNAAAVLTSDAHVFCYCDQLYVGLVQKFMGKSGLIRSACASG